MASEQPPWPGLNGIIVYLEGRIADLKAMPQPVGSFMYSRQAEELESVRALVVALRDAIRARHAEHVRHLPRMWTDSVASDISPAVRNGRAAELAWVLRERSVEEK